MSIELVMPNGRDFLNKGKIFTDTKKLQECDRLFTVPSHIGKYVNYVKGGQDGRQRDRLDA